MKRLVPITGVGCLIMFTAACGSTGTDATGTGGSVGTGGALGAGGSAATGSGGSSTAGAGGSVSDAGAMGGQMITKAYTFDTGLEAWKVTYTDAQKAMNGNPASTPI